MVKESKMTQEQFEATQYILLESIFGKCDKTKLLQAITVVEDMLIHTEIKEG